MMIRESYYFPKQEAFGVLSSEKKVSRAWPDGCHALRACGLPWSLGRWVSRASGLCSPMISDHEHNWGHWGAGWVSRASGLWSPMVSYHWGRWGRCHALRACGLPWSPIMSTIGAIGAGWVSRASGLWSPMVSYHWAIGAGVTRFGPVVSHGLRS